MLGRRSNNLNAPGVARAFWSRVDRWEIRTLVENGSCDPSLVHRAQHATTRVVGPFDLLIDYAWDVKRIAREGHPFIVTFLLTRRSAGSTARGGGREQ